MSEAGVIIDPSTALNERPAKPDRVSWPTIILVFAALFLLNILLRVFYLRYDFVNGDESIRALTAVRMLEGAQLYIDVVTDKPPGTTLFYAGVFRIFGRSMVAVHLVAAVWNFLTSIVVYAIASRLYSRKVGLWSALLFIYFSTNYLTQDVMAANTELLMVLPYSLSFLLFATSRLPGAEHSRKNALAANCLLLAAGALTGLAVGFKQVGIFNLAFFVCYELADSYSRSDKQTILSRTVAAVRSALPSLILIGLGFALVVGLLLAWLASSGALGAFYRYTIEFGRFYAGAIPATLWLKFMLGRTLGYVFLNGALWGLAIWTVAKSIMAAVRRPKPRCSSKVEEASLAISLWGLVSLAAVFPTGRFFGHYFIQVLPALCLLAGRGLNQLLTLLSAEGKTLKPKLAAVLLVLLFLVGLVRFHHRTAVLAYEWATGRRTEISASWGMTRRQDEAEIIASRVNDIVAPGESIYIWEYALDVYWKSGRRPASRFLVPYFLTGQFPEDQEIVASDNVFWRENRRLFLEDLQRAKPEIVLDTGGSLLNLPYIDIVDFVRAHYDQAGELGINEGRPFVLLRRRNADASNR